MIRIKFLCAGGTISQAPGPDGVLAPPANADEFQKAVQPVLAGFAHLAQFDFEVVTIEDSVDMTPTEWGSISQAVARAQEEEGFHAVLITHGTDTMANTAAFLSLSLHGFEGERRTGLKIPVCLTGSQLPISVTGGDGEMNLSNAIRALVEAAEQNIADVMVVFGDEISRGCDAVKISEKRFNAIRDAKFPKGTIDSEGVRIFPGIFRDRNRHSYGPLNPITKCGTGIQVISVQPGLAAPNFEGASAVLFICLGEGNIPKSWVPCIKELSEKDIPVVLVSPFVGGSAKGKTYASGVRGLEAGAISGRDHTVASALAKAFLLLGNLDHLAMQGLEPLNEKWFDTRPLSEETHQKLEERRQRDREEQLKKRLSCREVFAKWFRTSMAGEVTI